MKQVPLKDGEFNDYGCPTTEMRSQKAQFEQENPGLNFHMKHDAPHYSSAATRQAFFQWQQSKGTA